jgi:hypothetical protein
MSKPNIGKILDSDQMPVRDAIHVPIIPTYATQILNPGDRISVVRQDGKLVAKAVTKMSAALGVVDPYLEKPVQIGQLFYCFVKPNTVRKLWHEWTHNELDRT